MRPSEEQVRDDIVKISNQCVGWSKAHHYNYFSDIVNIWRPKRILMLGVFCGRDIAIISQIYKYAELDDYKIIGVDKFSDEPCQDWNPGEDWYNLTQDFGPPRISITQANLETLGFADNVELIVSDSESYMVEAIERGERFDFIYVDTSHDYDTVQRELELAKDLLPTSGIIGGDDFRFYPTYGVIQAVDDTFKRYSVPHEEIWLATKKDYR